MADHGLAGNPETGGHVGELTVAVGGLVQVHEVHVDLGPRQLHIRLRVQVQERLAQRVEPGDPHLGWRERVHPRNHAHDGGARVGLIGDRADCLGVGALFSTSTKADADVLPKETLRDICAAVDIPVVAIGGISESNIMQLSGTGVDGVALVSAIFGAEDIESECRTLKALSENMVRA